MEAKFTTSVVLAVNFVLGLASSVRGQIWKDKRLVQPTWCNFLFFRRIKALPIRRMERVAPKDGNVGHWNLEREVEFYLREELVAVVYLVGQKYDQLEWSGNHLDNSSGWAISRVSYTPVFPSPSDGRAVEWINVPLEVKSYTLFAV